MFNYKLWVIVGNWDDIALSILFIHLRAFTLYWYWITKQSDPLNSNWKRWWFILDSEFITKSSTFHIVWFITIEDISTYKCSQKMVQLNEPWVSNWSSTLLLQEWCKGNVFKDCTCRSRKVRHIVYSMIVHVGQERSGTLCTVWLYM